MNTYFVPHASKKIVIYLILENSTNLKKQIKSGKNIKRKNTQQGLKQKHAYRNNFRAGHTVIYALNFPGFFSLTALMNKAII